MSFPQKECNNACEVSKSEQKSDCCKMDSDLEKDCCSNMDDHIHFFNHENVSFSNTSCGYEIIKQENTYYSIPNFHDSKLISYSLSVLDPNLHSLNDPELNHKKSFTISYSEPPIYLSNSNLRI